MDIKCRNLTLVFNHFEQEHLGKDVFLVPYYLGRLLNYNVKIVYRKTKTNKNFPRIIKGIQLVPLLFIGNNNTPFYISNIYNLLYIIFNSRKIDILMCFHHDCLTELRIFLYKIFNPKGRVYVKLDIGELREYPLSKNKFKRKCRQKLTDSFLKYVDFISCETSNIYSELVKTNLSHHQYGNKLFLMPNGFDEDLLKSLHIEEKTFEEKENIFITVGRIGDFVKNSEMILDALKDVEMKGWKFYFIGPIEPSFQKKIDEFFFNYPQKLDSVRFIGPVFNKIQLWGYYNISKVFVFSSRSESYGLVLNEACRFRNYIISTPVGAFYDITNNETYGSALIQDDSLYLAQKMQQIIDGKLNINVYHSFNPINVSWEHQIHKLSDKIKNF